MSEVEKKDVTQDQLEGILRDQFDKTQTWQNFLLVMVVIVPLSLLFLMGFADVNIVAKIAAYVILGITLAKCENWVADRRIRKTIEAMKAL